MSVDSHKRHDAIWVAWETQRRSIELSKQFDAELYIFQGKGSRFLKYWKPIFNTFLILCKRRPKVLFVQNPSIFLALLGVILRPLFKYYLVVDRHTNFKLHARNSKNPKWLAFHCISKFTLRKADLTIVTNKYLKLLVNQLGGNAVILPDKIPDFSERNISKIKLKHTSALFVCTYADDEPYELLFKIMKTKPWLHLYVTGKVPSWLDASLMPENVHLLGFVPEENYLSYLKSVDFVIVLTTQEFTLNCGSYEAIAAGKPMLLSGTKTIRGYFNGGSTYVFSYSEAGIEQALDQAVKEVDSKSVEIDSLKRRLNDSWSVSHAHAIKKIENARR